MNTENDEEPRGEGGESLADVLASIRSLVSSETASRLVETPDEEDVLMLTSEMRTGELLAQGLEKISSPQTQVGAPILDEEALRGVINAIVREELQGELGERISRNLQKVVRREISQMLEAERGKS